ncbi:hypothetical protein [Shewanella sp. GXUN23E]|uniref:hypothetical protein n=1 Tax=Shewanella sp. GXUN23E TaxID=3422498 RepID=UPI003D7DE677
MPVKSAPQQTISTAHTANPAHSAHGPTLKSAFATLQIGAARSDGTLYLTNTEVLFEPLSKALSLGRCRFSRQAISEVQQCLGKGAGILPLTRDAIRITLNSGEHYEFVLANPDQWINALQAVAG